MFTPNSTVPERFHRLLDLAHNLWFSWNEEALMLFRQMNPDRWEDVYHNPVRQVLEATHEDWDRLSADSLFIEQYDRVMALWEHDLNGETWFAEQYPDRMNGLIAYFSAEFGFHESLPIYSGGLGVLAGDHIKAASDLGLPLTGVGLLYRKGYFRQSFDSNGNQTAERIDHDFTRLPVTPVQRDGANLTVEISLAEGSVRLQVWHVQVGRVSLYLLDSDVEGNSPETRELTSQLYGGNQEMRIAQEMILGIGGVKALRALGLNPNVYHINEGHAAFLSIERMREYIHSGVPFDTALELIRASTVFTTHTPVPAGHDAFPLEMLNRYLNPLLSQLVYERERIVQLGFDADKNLFNMTYLAMNTASLRNGVSKLHGQVSRVMFRSFHGSIQVGDVPIGHVTNGVHMQTWLAPELQQLFDRFFPAGWRRQQSSSRTWDSLDAIPDEALWEIHERLKLKLIGYARDNIREQRRRNGESSERIEEVSGFLQPHVLTIGFARRFATYKRANLLFKDLDRLDRIVNDPNRPVQFIFAGKAHPADYPGQDLIREIYRVSQLEAFRGKIVLLENYDVNMARYLVQGVDIWLNNPLRPLEASGTSGQKAAMNGALNFSILDGWWEEGYDGKNGWPIDSHSESDWQVQERENAESLYSRLGNEIQPLYYSQGPVPTGWVDRMKHSIRTLAPEYNTHRMVEDYSRDYYTRTMERFGRLVSDNHATASELAAFKQKIREQWHYVEVISVADDRSAPAAPGMKEIKADIRLGTILPGEVAVELVYYQDTTNGVWEPVLVPLEPEEDRSGGIFRFRASIPLHLIHVQHYSIRFHPAHPLFTNPYEVPQFFTTVP